MHSPETVARVLALHEAGLGARRISGETGVPVRTVTDWLRGQTPRSWTRELAPRCPSCGASSHRISNWRAYAYLLGMYLGDGYIAPHARGVYKLRVNLDDRYPEIIDECSAAIQVFVPDNPVRRLARPGCTEVYAYSKTWPCLLPHVAPGRKHTRKIVLQRWQLFFVEEYPMDLLRGLIHSDGCRFVNTGRDGWRAPRYGFKNFSPDIRRIFCEACDVLRLHWTESGNTIYVSRKADVARLDEYIGPKR